MKKIILKTILRLVIMYTITFSIIFIQWELEMHKPKDYTYPICSVVETYNTENETILVCEMPNGELHEYKIEDAPEGKIELVCFKTTNQDNYTSYEVVSVR